MGGGNWHQTQRHRYGNGAVYSASAVLCHCRVNHHFMQREPERERKEAIAQMTWRNYRPKQTICLYFSSLLTWPYDVGCNLSGSNNITFQHFCAAHSISLLQETRKTQLDLWNNQRKTRHKMILVTIQYAGFSVYSSSNEMIT